MIAFTVMDHDVITANDFAGEAFLSLNNIPGVAELNMGVENLGGLKAIDLVLMQQRDKRESNQKSCSKLAKNFPFPIHRSSDFPDPRESNFRQASARLRSQAKSSSYVVNPPRKLVELTQC